jgi:tetratricopeptide (TPR) repeat protein
MKLPAIARAALLTIGAAALMAPVPATAQTPAHALTLARPERAALAALQAAAAGSDRAAQDTALAAARAVAQSASARYALGSIQFQLGRARGDVQMQNQAIDALVASGVPQGAELASLLAAQASRTYSAGDLRGTDALLARVVELQPNNPAVVADYAQFKARLGERPQAVTLFQRAIELQQATGQAAPESWHHRALALAFDARLAPQGLALARGLVAAYPSPVNWRDALLACRQLGTVDATLDVDIGRLLRATGALSGERDYLELARALNTAGVPGEAKAVLDEGVARGQLTATEPAVRQLVTQINPRAAAARTGLARGRTQALAATTGAPALAAGDAQFGFGNYAEAAELYRAALQKGGQDANLVNTRLGVALGLAGQRAEAEAALRAVTGPRADLAGFWLIRLSRPAA